MRIRPNPYAPMNVTPWRGGGGGGGAGNGWGFDQEVKVFANFPRVGKDAFIKCS